MNSFACPICLNEREFQTFSIFFRHVTIFHQSDPSFRIVCNISPTCGTLYRTFSGYKSHVYRYHQSELHPVHQNTIATHSNDNDQQQ
jgi:hypothetical protein